MDPEPYVLVAQLSDPHIVERDAMLHGVLDTEPYLVAAVELLRHLDPQPGLVLISGDLVNEGRPEQYENLRRLLEPLQVPVRLMCGNHDDPVGLRQVFHDHAYLGSSGQVDYVIDELPPLRIVVLDTHVAGEPGGSLSASQLAWLDDRLVDAADRVCLIAMHHPPFLTGIGHMDAMRLDDASVAGLAEVVGRHAHVERVICGHLHRSIVRRFAGTIAMTVPGNAHAVRLDLRPGLTIGAADLEPPAVTLHLWRPETGLVTHTRSIGTFPSWPFG